MTATALALLCVVCEEAEATLRVEAQSDKQTGTNYSYSACSECAKGLVRGLILSVYPIGATNDSDNQGSSALQSSSEASC